MLVLPQGLRQMVAGEEPQRKIRERWFRVSNPLKLTPIQFQAVLQRHWALNLPNIKLHPQGLLV